MGGLDACERLLGGETHFRGDHQVRPKRGGSKEAGERGVEAGGARGQASGSVGSAGIALVTGNVVGDDTEVTAKLGDIPAGAAKDAQLGLRADKRIQFTGEGADERRFATAVGAKDGDMFASANGEREVMKNLTVSERDRDVAHLQEGYIGSRNGSHFVRLTE